MWNKEVRSGRSTWGRGLGRDVDGRGDVGGRGGGARGPPLAEELGLVAGGHVRVEFRRPHVRAARLVRRHGVEAALEPAPAFAHVNVLAGGGAGGARARALVLADGVEGALEAAAAVADVHVVAGRRGLIGMSSAKGRQRRLAAAAGGLAGRGCCCSRRAPGGFGGLPGGFDGACVLAVAVLVAFAAARILAFENQSFGWRRAAALSGIHGLRLRKEVGVGVGI